MDEGLEHIVILIPNKGINGTELLTYVNCSFTVICD